MGIKTNSISPYVRCAAEKVRIIVPLDHTREYMRLVARQLLEERLARS